MDNKRPFFSIALSGGGIRAAAHSLGLITALVEAWDKNTTKPRWASTRAKLGPIGIISSVSGGGYTAAGILAHIQKMRQNPKSEANLESAAKDDEQVALLSQAPVDDLMLLRDLAAQVFRTPNYLGGSGPLGSSGALKMLAAILARAVVFLFEFSLFSFLLGSLISSVCSCAAGDGECPASTEQFIWLCPNFFEGGDK